MRAPLLGCFGLLACLNLAFGQEPILRIDAGGPTALVTGVAFSPDGKKLYAAGFDKIVRVWELNADGRFEPAPRMFRVPIGPGHQGVINALALSSDGTWLAVGGRSVVPGGSTFGRPGVMLPSAALTSSQWEHAGTIHVFDTTAKQPVVKSLRGHRGPVLALAFVPQKDGKPPLLISAGQEHGDKETTGAVRLWSVAEGKELARNVELPNPVDGFQPGLAGWRQADEVRVAIAWRDAKLRLWRPEKRSDAMSDYPERGEANDALLLLENERRIVTGSFDRRQGHLQSWQPTAGGLATDGRVQIDFAQRNSPGNVLVYDPRALAGVSSKADGTIDYLAVATRETQVQQPAIVGERVYLQLGRLGENALSERISLGNAPVGSPLVAAAPGGRHLAVAGTGDHVIRVFRVGDLVDRRQAEPQVLHAIGTSFRRVSFARKGNQHGLSLHETARGDEQAAVFALSEGKLLDDPAGWQPVAPATDGWAIRPEGRTFRVFHNDNLVGRVPLRDGQKVTASARLLPTSKFAPVPLLAVGLVEGGEPVLAVFNVKTGEKVRQLSGHIGTVRALAFSEDGSRLVSAGDDQLVCVWRLDDLPETLGQRGALHGIPVSEQDGRLVVAATDQRDAVDPKNRNRLRPGDAITGVVSGTKVMPLKSARDFYNAVALVKPRSDDPPATITLRVAGKEGDVELVVGQGADERKPLFSLFLTQEHRWIGWHPTGPYDFSDVGVEERLSWHFNTGNPVSPTRESAVKEDRKEMRRPGLLAALYTQGEPPKPAPPPPKEPRMTLWLDELGAHAAAVLRQPRAKLVMHLEGLEAREVTNVLWRIGAAGGTMRPSRENDNEWEAELDGPTARWKRGENKVEVILRTPATARKDHVQALAVSYRPSAPVIKLAGKDRQTVPADAAKFTFEADVSPAVDGEAVRVRVIHVHGDKETRVGEEQIVERAGRITRPVTLGPGVNSIKIVAENRDASEESLRDESRLLVQEVTLRTKAPTFSLEKLDTLDSRKATVASANVVPGEANPVGRSRIRLSGIIKADEGVTATWSKGVDGRREPLEKLTGEKGEVKFVQEFLLDKPGRHEFRLHARSADSEESTATLLVQFTRPTPTLTMEEPRNSAEIVAAGKDTVEVDVKGRIDWPEDSGPGQAVVLVDGQVKGEPLPLATGVRAFAARIALGKGSHILQVKLQGAAAPATPAVSVAVLRPPIMLSALKVTQAKGRPFADVTVEAETPEDLSLSRSELTLNGRKRLIAPEGTLSKGTEPGKPWQRWTFHLKELALEKGDNALALRVANDDGWSQKEATAILRNVEVNPPEVVVNDDVSRTCSEAQYAYSFSVRSKTRLLSIEVLNNGEAVQRVGVSDLRPDESGEFALSTSVTVPLTLGDNDLQVVAVNDPGGAARKPDRPTRIHYQPVPVQLVIEKLSAAGDMPAELKSLQQVTKNTTRYQEAPIGRVRLQGKVIWTNPEEKRLRTAHWLRLFVNGRQELHVPVVAQSGDSANESSFNEVVFLDRTHGNRIELRLPENQSLRHDQSIGHECLLDCARPIGAGKRKLHLVIVDADRESAPDLKERVLRMLGARLKNTYDFVRDADQEEGSVYGPVTRGNLKADLMDEFLNIRRAIERRMRANRRIDRPDEVHDVVLVYYRGPDLCGISSSEPGELAQQLAALRGSLAESYGAQLLLLDDHRSVEPAIGWNADLPEGPHLAVLKYTWFSSPGAASPQPLLADVEKALKESPTVHLKELKSQLTADFVVKSAREPLVSRKYNEKLRFWPSLPLGLEDLLLQQPRP
jgi:WD40 repeat protein